MDLNHWLIAPVPWRPVYKHTVMTGLILLLVGLFLVGRGAKADTTGQVTVTVTVQNISVTITSDGSVAYGVLTTSATADTTSGGTNDSQTANNNGNVSENFNIMGANSTDWTLAAAPGSEIYAHKFCVTTCDTSPSWTALDTDYQALATGVAALGNQVFDLQISTPTATAVFDQQSTSVTIQAVSAS